MQVNFLLQNCEYESTGHDVFDLFELDEQSKYEAIIRAVQNMQSGVEVVPNLRYERLSLNLDRVRRLQVIHKVPEISVEAVKEWKDSSSIKEIIATATAVFVDVVSQKIGLTGDDSEYNKI